MTGTQTVQTNQENSDQLATEARRFSFDRSFQEKIVQAMLIDHPWASQFAEVVEVSYFTHRFLKLVVDRHLQYYKTYKEFASMDLLLTMLKDDLRGEKDETLREQVKAFLIRISLNENLGDLPFIKEKALDFCKRAALQKALNDSIDLIKSEKYEKIIEVVKSAIHAGNHHSPGLDLFEDVAARYSETFRKTVATGIQELDQRKILNGGLGSGELGVVVAPTGCHAKGSLILMYDGSQKKVENVFVGDKLMGPDSKPRIVKKLISGKEKMYKIQPMKGEPFTVNENHILSLVRTNLGKKSRNTKKNGEILNISVKEFLTKSKTFKHMYKLYSVGVEFDKIFQTTLPIPPYIMGILLGDGYIQKNRIELTTADNEILTEWEKFAQEQNLNISKHSKKQTKAAGYYLTNNHKHNNPVNNFLAEMHLIGKKSKDKFIPSQYKISSRENRLQLLAGLIDTDGHLHGNCFDYITKSKQLADDIAFLTRSLGLAAHIKTVNKHCQNGFSGQYYRLTISGEINQIPCRLKRKQSQPRYQTKNVLRTGFLVEPMDEDYFYGFNITGDHLYLMGNFVVSHNCGKSHFLVHVGAQALLRGKSVLHYTFELNERAMGIRYDSHIIDIPSLECYEAKDEIQQYYEENKENLGRLKIKYYPTSSASCMTLRGHIEKLATQAFRPDIVIVDYAGIMRSSDRYELLRMELKKVMEELRSLATELDIPVWTAIQSNKEGAQNDVVDLTNMAEGYGQAHVADFVVGLSRKSAQKATGFGNIFIAKNRSGVDGIKYQVHLDTAKSKLRILTDDEVADYSNDFEEDEFKIARQKLATIQQRRLQK